MRNKKGQFQMGFKHTEETKRNISKNNARFWSGKKLSEETKRKLSKAHKGHTAWNKGMPMSEETKRKMSVRLENAYKNGFRGTLGKKHSEEAKEKNRQAHLGKKLSIETRRKLSAWNKKRINSGTHNFWKGGIDSINKKIRGSLEYKLWRESVFKRDNWTCVWCKQRGGKLNADHIKPFALFPELRFAIDNGRTLCIDCHRKTNTYGGVKRK